MKKIAMGNDHSAVEMKEAIKAYVEQKGYEVIDFGTNSSESCDYPVYGEKVGRAVASGEADYGIAICGTGIGISLAANKVPGIRAAVCSEPYSAMMTAKHNASQIIAFGARVVGNEMAKMILDSFFNTPFEGGRHAERVQKIIEIEKKYNK